MVRLGYDSITTVLVTYIATQIGFASSWMNPFCVVVAQGIAGVPVLSGSGLRIVVWVIATMIGLIFTMVYASRVKKNPLLSRVHESDRFFREKQADVEQRPFTFGDWLVLIVLTAVMVWVIWGVIVNAWFIPEIASQFFTMGLLAESDANANFMVERVSYFYPRSPCGERLICNVPQPWVVRNSCGQLWQRQAER